MDAIVVEGVSKTYRSGKVQALKDLSLTVRKGEVFGIIGPNGAGKTTLMSCLLGLLRPDSGRILIDGKPPDDLDVLRLAGYVPERLVFDRWMTGRGFLAYHHALAEQSPVNRRAEVAALLGRVGLDAAAANQKVKRYSRGMLQRLAFAQALVGAPAFLYLDEPTSGMDPTGVVMVRKILLELRERGVTVVLNSHQLEQVERLSDRVAYVDKGAVTSVESLAVGVDEKRVLAVTISSKSGGADVSEARLRELGTGVGAELLAVEGQEARFCINDEEGSVKLIAELVKAGVPVTQAVPDVGRLERLFEEGQGRTGS